MHKYQFKIYQLKNFFGGAALSQDFAVLTIS
jgi:hypothetical protein